MMRIIPAGESLTRLFTSAMALAGASLVVPPDTLLRPWGYVYPAAQALLFAATLTTALLMRTSESGKGALLLNSPHVQWVLCVVTGAAVQSVYPHWSMAPLIFVLLFPFSGFARHIRLFWVPALALSVVAAGRFLFEGDVGLLQWSVFFILFSGALGIKISKDWQRLSLYQNKISRYSSDAREMMGRIQREGSSISDRRIRKEEAARNMAVEEDEFLQKLLTLGCRYFNARAGILLVPGDPGYFRMRAAVGRGVSIGEISVSADKGFIHIANQRGGTVCLSDGRSAARSLGFYQKETVVGSLLVKIVYDPDWARDAGEETGPQRISCVLYFDSSQVGQFSLDDVTVRRLEEYGSLVHRAMKLTGMLQEFITDMSAKDAIARYSKNLTRYLDPEKITEKALEGVLKALPNCDGAVVMLADEGVRIFRSEGEVVKDLSHEQILRDEPSQVGLLLRRFSECQVGGNLEDISRAEIVLSGEKSRPAPFFYRGEKSGRIISFAAVPSFLADEGGRTVLKAVIAAVSGKRDAFHHDDIEDLRTIAGMMAPALDNALQHSRVNELSRTDGLTGLLNHRTFQLVLEGKIKRVNRGYDPSIALIMVDVDHFKNVNDTYGHPVGDEVLVELAHRLKRDVRSNDAVARYGGEEFAVVLDNVNEKETARIAEKMRREVGTRRFDTSAGPLDITASFGFSVLHRERPISGESLIDEADRALYNAKRNGRNTVVCYCDLKENRAVKHKAVPSGGGPRTQEEWQW